jgi:hypothetical protein
MRRSIPVRLLALLCAGLAAGSASALTVAHGVAHRHASHDAAHHAHDADAADLTGSASFEEAEPPLEHPHPEIADRRVAPGHPDLPADLSAVTEVPTAVIASVAGAAPEDRAAGALPGPARDSPRQPRAPPLG